MAVKVLLDLPSGPAVLRALIDDPRRGTTCLEKLFHLRDPTAREVLRDVIRTGTPRQREVVLMREPDVASAEDLPWIREAIERRSRDAEASAVLSPWDGPLVAIERVPVAHLQGRHGRIVELSEPTSRMLRRRCRSRSTRGSLPRKPTPIKARFTLSSGNVHQWLA